MRPIRLDMEGFGAFKDPTSVDFEDVELVALVGRTGSGKSTVIDAMTFALYGCVARYDDNRAVAPVINQTSTRARVRLEFELGGRRYTAARLVQRQGTGATTKEARLECGDDVLAADARRMTAVVGTLLGLDAAQFNRTIVLPQGRFADFLHDDPGKRQETLRGLLGLGMYRDVASAARRRAGDRKIEADAIRAETEADSVELTAERRAALVARGTALATARATLADAMALADARRSEAAIAERRLAVVRENLLVLATMTSPEGLADLERKLADAATALAETTRAVAAARKHRRETDAAAAAGPDVAKVSADLAARHDATRAGVEHAATAAQLAEAERRAASTAAAAAECRAEQERLDAAARSAAEAERTVGATLDTMPSLVQLDHWLAQRGRLAQLTVASRSATRDLEAATARVESLRWAANEASEVERTTRQSRDRLREQAGAAGLAHLLAVGVPCPMCLQEVHTIPLHHVDEDLVAADAALDAAISARDRATANLDAADRAAQAERARLDAEQRSLDALRRELVDVVSDAELVAQRQAVIDGELVLSQARAATAAADGAARTHRSAASTLALLDASARAAGDVAALRPLAARQRDRLAGAQRAVQSLAPLDTLERALADATALAAARDAAATGLVAAETAHETAMTIQRAGEVAQRSAIEELYRARDRVAPLQPPRVGGEALGASWQRLLDWARATSLALAVERDELVATVVASTRAADGATTIARAAYRELVGPSDAPLPSLRDALIAEIATNAADLVAFDQAREQLAARVTRIERLDAERAVADQLGHLLRADGFEAWLMQAALGELVEAAGARLRELSSGQFALELVGREVMVRDHSNADELRGARTLSGGETFLASLSLALALADATSDLAPEGAPRLESIFLDEGFGTLDPATLDVVAGAIEELGAAGRMVAVVTHIRDLAERMPVRLEVAKVGASSTVERIDA